MIIYDGADKVLNTLRKWKLEMDSPYNDGWVREGFKEKLLKVQEFFKTKHLDEALNGLKNSEGLATYEDEIELYETYGGD
tara:strand:- start:258 stop:497 length:240 start_codon:yes stop_codon:yes gene_type:complete